MNQYRCETCQKRAGKLICNTFVNEANGDISGVLWSTSIIGCASHSDFQSERDKVLDELQRWGMGYYGYEVNVATLQAKIKELRQQAGEP
jgi:hypothetical protein